MRLELTMELSRVCNLQLSLYIPCFSDGNHGVYTVFTTKKVFLCLLLNYGISSVLFI